MPNKPRPICPNGHAPDYFIIPIYYVLDDRKTLERAEIDVTMYPNGELTGAYEDGTVGLSPDDRFWAEQSEDAICPVCGDGCTWEDDDPPEGDYWINGNYIGL